MFEDDEQLTEAVRSNRCPDCENWGFIPGPRGGAGQNVYCANPECRAAFMIAPRGNIAMVQRAGKASLAFYPPRVHVLLHGQPLCNFAGVTYIDNGPPPRFELKRPDEWPPGHCWVGLDDLKHCNCPICLEQAKRHQQ